MSKDPSHGYSCLQVRHEACVTGLASVDPWLGYLPRGFYQIPMRGMNDELLAFLRANVSLSSQ